MRILPPFVLLSDGRRLLLRDYWQLTMTHPSDSRAYFFKIDTTIKKIRNALQKQFNDAGFDLTVDQWVIIDHMYRNPGISQNTLSEMTTKDAPTITRIIDLLSQKDLTQRRMADTDRRKFLVFLTEAGEAKYHEVLPVVSAMRRKGWGSLSDDDYQQFIRIMDSIYTNVSE